MNTDKALGDVLLAKMLCDKINAKLGTDHDHGDIVKAALATFDIILDNELQGGVTIQFDKDLSVAQVTAQIAIDLAKEAKITIN